MISLDLTQIMKNIKGSYRAVFLKKKKKNLTEPSRLMLPRVIIHQSEPEPPSENVFLKSGQIFISNYNLKYGRLPTVYIKVDWPYWFKTVETVLESIAAVSKDTESELILFLNSEMQLACLSPSRDQGNFESERRREHWKTFPSIF